MAGKEAPVQSSKFFVKFAAPAPVIEPTLTMLTVEAEPFPIVIVGLPPKPPTAAETFKGFGLATRRATSRAGQRNHELTACPPVL